MPTKLDIEAMKEMAKIKGGECLSEVYVNSYTNLKWKCANNHEWSARPDSIRNNGSWCLKCTGKEKLTIEEMQKIAKERGGECLSDKYKDENTKLLWKCAEQHTWLAKPSKIKHNESWCPKCVGKAKYTMEELREVAAKKGGKCLSNECKNSDDKLTWECENKHTWVAAARSIKNNGSWCPLCPNNWKHEKYCRKVFETLLNCEFPKVKPDFLRYPETNYKLELDGYNPDLYLAFESNGIHHYEYHEHFHKGDVANFIKQQEHDRFKAQKCEDNGVFLVVIPYTVNTKEKIDDTICERLEEYEMIVDRNVLKNIQF